MFCYREEGREYALNVHSDVVTVTIPKIKKLSAMSEIEITFKNISHVSHMKLTFITHKRRFKNFILEKKNTFRRRLLNIRNIPKEVQKTSSRLP